MGYLEGAARGPRPGAASHAAGARRQEEKEPMTRDPQGRALDDDGELLNGMVVTPTPGDATKGSTTYYVEGCEVGAETYRLWLYDKEVDARHDQAGVLALILQALERVAGAASPRPPAPVPAPAAPAPTPPAPAAAPAPRRFITE